MITPNVTEEVIIQIDDNINFIIRQDDIAMDIKRPDSNINAIMLDVKLNVNYNVIVQPNTKK
jgi:hypothetical protein